MPFTLKFTSRYTSLHLQAPIQIYIKGVADLMVFSELDLSYLQLS